MSGGVGVKVSMRRFVRRRTALRLRRRGIVAVAAGAIAVIAGATASVAQAIPEYSDPNLVTTLDCPSANPWPLGPLPVKVDVFNGIRFPADGLPGPAITLIGSIRGKPQLVEYTTQVRVTWRNLGTGARGVVSAPSRARTVSWQIDLHPGAGPVAFTIHQTIGAVAFLPMVNPQYSTCRGVANA